MIFYILKQHIFKCVRFADVAERVITLLHNTEGIHVLALLMNGKFANFVVSFNILTVKIFFNDDFSNFINIIMISAQLHVFLFGTNRICEAHQW